MKGLKEIANDNAVSTTVSDALDQPFPNLRTREVVKSVVEGIAETCAQSRLTDGEQLAFALGTIRGARIVAEQTADDSTRLYLATLLDRLNRGGVAAITRLVEVVTGHPIPAAA